MWGTRFSDDVSHILVGDHHGCCSRAVARGLEMCVLDGVNTRSFAGSGWGSYLQGSVALDHLWDLCLDKYTGDGRFDGVAFLVGC